MDPLAELYFSHSTYGYVRNNPVILLDPNGMNDVQSMIQQAWDDTPEGEQAVFKYFTLSATDQENSGHTAVTYRATFRFNQKEKNWYFDDSEDVSYVVENNPSLKGPNVNVDVSAVDLGKSSKPGQVGRSSFQIDIKITITSSEHTFASSDSDSESESETEARFREGEGEGDIGVGGVKYKIRDTNSKTKSKTKSQGTTKTTTRYPTVLTMSIKMTNVCEDHGKRITLEAGDLTMKGQIISANDFRTANKQYAIWHNLNNKDIGVMNNGGEWTNREIATQVVKSE